MRPILTASVVLLAIMLSSCFNVDTNKLCLTCNPGNQCLDGQSCVDGYCKVCNGGKCDYTARCLAILDLGQQSGDMSGPGPGPTDMTAPPIPQTVKGCASPGYVVGKAYACPGIFDNDNTTPQLQAKDLCAAGYSLCTSAANVDLVACSALSGFYVSTAQLHKPPLTCGPPAMGVSRLFAGCGNGAVDTALLFYGANPCLLFTQAVDCSISSAWQCQNATTVNNVAQTSALNGVLCC